MPCFYDDNEDLRFYVERAIDWENLVRLTEYDGRAVGGPASTAEAVSTFQDILRLVGTFAAEQVAPAWRALDKEHPYVSEGEVEVPATQAALFQQLAELGLHGLCIPRELGGMNSPFLLFHLTTELLARADVSVCAHSGFHGGIAMAMLAYSIQEGTTHFDASAGQISSTRFAKEIEEIIQGSAWGSMDITEPDAGSDMAALRCRAELGEDGVWRVFGQKVYITSGHGKYHFVICRTEPVSKPDDPFSGLGGLSMFLVPAFEDGPNGRIRKHTTIDGVEKKLGHNASATVAISFEGAPGHLIGKRGEGFKHMLMLMNNARVGVGFESIGLCEAAYRGARAYAASRGSMGKTIDRHEMIADYLDEMATDLQALRALAVHAGYHEEMQQKLDIQQRYFPPSDLEALRRQRSRHQRKAREATPLLKYLAAEKAVEMARRGLQIHGGAGYTQDYQAEKLLRDAVVMPIYEGTSQIQSLMAMKDTLLGIIRSPQDFLRRSARSRWEAVSARSPLARRVARLDVLRNRTLRNLLSRLATHKLGELKDKPMGAWVGALQGWDPKRDFALAMLHAERLTRILSDVLVARVLLEQVERFPERAGVLERWLERAEPRCASLELEIATSGHRLLAELEAPVYRQAAK